MYWIILIHKTLLHRHWIHLLCPSVPHDRTSVLNRLTSASAGHSSSGSVIPLLFPEPKIDDSEFNQSSEHERSAETHPNVDGLNWVFLINLIGSYLFGISMILLLLTFT